MRGRHRCGLSRSRAGNLSTTPYEIDQRYQRLENEHIGCRNAEDRTGSYIRRQHALLTPVGYQTNLMMYGTGGYKFTDFGRVGAPLQVLLPVVTIFEIVFF